jgi:hypothetical protein
VRGPRDTTPYTRRQRPAIPVRVGRFVRLSEGMTMKAILTATVAVALCAVTLAQEKKADPVGTWKCEYTIGDQKREATLTIKKDGDKLIGTMSWADQKDAKLDDVKLKDTELTFAAVREFMDMKIPIKYAMKIDGDKLKGKGESNFSGETFAFDIEGKREVKVEAKDAKKGG